MESVSTSDRCCAVPNCCAIAVDGDRCVIHARASKVTYVQTCVSCSKPIEAGEWFRPSENGARHINKCPSSRLNQ
jgi:hypothetical protein